MKQKILNKTKPPSYNVIPFIREYNHIAISDLEDILETLEDMGYLNEDGIKFRSKMWAKFIYTFRENDVSNN